jgi:periplasmic glucans biosynthesis protein
VKGALLAGAGAAGSGIISAPAAGQTAHPPPGSRFSYGEVVTRAVQLASVPFEGQLPPLPDELNKLDWDHWRQIEFRDTKALLGGNGSQFRLELFHLGHLYKRPVVINTVRDGIPTPVPYQASQFNYGPTHFTRPLPVNLGFAGFKVRTPLNEPRKWDEFISFVGSSYFRFLGRGQAYGLSARGLALAGGTNQEEFPFYREFWIEMPEPEADKLTLYALLDSSVVTGAYRFDCYPQRNSIVDVEVTLVPRRNGVKIGHMPLTSMYFIGANDHRFTDAFRPQLHDSDGLQMHAGSGEWIWRPLRNPTLARTASFFDHDPQGFGLLQRDRHFTHYEDIDLAYQKRPSYWITPKTKLGEGHVELFEMPTTDESNDNIVASWVSKDDVQPGRQMNYSYAITSALELDGLSDLGKVAATFQTAARALGTSEPDLPNVRRFLIDFNGGDLGYYADDPGQVQIVATSDVGKVLRSWTQANPFIKGFRGTLDVEVPAGATANLRAFLKAGATTLTETWMYSWEAPGAPAAAH